MITLKQVYNHLKDNDIKYKAVNPSIDYHFNDEIVLNENYSLEILLESVKLYFKNTEVDEFTSLNQTFTNRLKSL